MGRIKSVKTEPEELLKKQLWALGLRYRSRLRTPAGKADLVLWKRKLALYVDGCFWHGCPEHYVRPRSSTSFWDDKLIENVNRDRNQTLKLLSNGWTVIRVWEHQVREDLELVAASVFKAIKRGGPGSWPNWRVATVHASADDSDELRTLVELVGTAKRTERGPRRTAKVGRVIRERV